MKRLAHIVEPNGQNHICPKCFRDGFYLTQGTSRKYLNKQKTVWKATSRYIYTCDTCGNKEYHGIYERLTYTNEADYNKIAV